MVKKEEDKTSAPKKAQPKASEAKKITKKTESAAEIDVVQGKKTLPVKRVGKPAAVGKRVKKAPKAPLARNIGIEMPPPKRSCEDRNCPFHGRLSVRGISLDVQVVSTKMKGTVVVKRERRHYVKKYQRYEKRTSRYMAHLPPCIDLSVGDMVKIMECRPLSKGTSFVVLGRI